MIDSVCKFDKFNIHMIEQIMAATGAGVYLISTYPARAVRALLGKIKDSESDSDFNGSDEEGPPHYVFTTATLNRMNKLKDQGTHTGEKRLEGSADRVMIYKAYTHRFSKIHDGRGCWKRLTFQKCGLKDSRRTIACTCMQHVNRYMTVENAPYKNYLI